MSIPVLVCLFAYLVVVSVLQILQIGLLGRLPGAGDEVSQHRVQHIQVVIKLPQTRHHLSRVPRPRYKRTIRTGDDAGVQHFVESDVCHISR